MEGLSYPNIDKACEELIAEDVELNENIEAPLYMDFNDIPFYFTYTDNATDEVKEEVADVLAIVQAEKNTTSLNSRSAIQNTDQVSELLSVTEVEYEIEELDAGVKEEILVNPMFESTLRQVQELLEDGIEVQHINFYLPEGADVFAASANNNNDPAYWERNCKSLGSYNGYKFLYMESHSPVSSSEVNVGQISSSIKWDAIANKVVKAAVKHKLGGVYKTVTAITG